MHGGNSWRGRSSPPFNAEDFVVADEQTAVGPVGDEQLNQSCDGEVLADYRRSRHQNGVQERQ
jgi:hypothetical protein